MQTRILLSSILVCRKEDLIIKGKEDLEKEKEKEYLQKIEQISKGYPLQYITNSKEFMGMDFFVNEDVLIPRSDTEVLVEEVIKIAKKEKKRDILDLCTGSGAIAISLQKNLDNVKITATDVSTKALNVAKKNEKRLLEKEDIKFVQSDSFETITEKYDIIVSNPPYIKTEVIKEYSLEYEPKLALDGGQDGLQFYRIIIEEGYKYLKDNGVIALEIGYDQKEDLLNLVKNSSHYKVGSCVKDLSGNDRVIIIR